jgi:hypothetical protein
MFKKLSPLIRSWDMKTFKGSSKSKSLALGFDFLVLVDRWEEVVGERLSKSTIPLKLQYGHMVVITAHPGIGQHLKFLEEDIIAKIEKLFHPLQGKIKSLRFQTNSSFFEKKIEESKKRRGEVADKPKLNPYSPIYKKYKKQAEALFADLEDEEIKKSMISIFIQMRYFD